MLAEERRQLILELLEQHKSVIAKDLADQFQLSVDSIRRDLTMMEEQGLLKKTYGGAVPLPKVRVLPLPDEQRYGEGSPTQNAVSRLAASRIRENDSVYLGGAGIQYGMLKYLSRQMPFTVVTNSLQVAQALRGFPNVEAYLIGGRLTAASGNLKDAFAQEQLRLFSFDLCFLTGGGVSERGVSTGSADGASLARTVLERSRQAVCLAPHEKLGLDLFAFTAPLDAFNLLITDERAPEETVRALAARGPQVLVARTGEEATD
ncbi:DeoR family transcriptional regulator [Paenibacillus sp. J31TS4]|uniref:DeoR/GlpR family DNA-binding transcription regulator n=1 Tax=Paenibacillus sp. J31TS4 TaxID=2807195 RepID=UPI001B23C819|nr:DeoR/GlpR family DNA-binding transcription regulator [Paenibacillus sp. J31TS4]GIP41236.1 DeoR family transcriptional regulator [Paenibacillus sp. J31TS4]